MQRQHININAGGGNLESAAQPDQLRVFLREGDGVVAERRQSKAIGEELRSILSAKNQGYRTRSESGLVYDGKPGRGAIQMVERHLDTAAQSGIERFGSFEGGLA